MSTGFAIAAIVAFCATIVVAVATTRHARPTPPTRRPRWAPRSLGILTALLAVAAVVLSLTAGPEWDRADNALSSLPVPPGYTDAGLTRRGDSNCNWNPSCVAPSVTRTFRPAQPTSRRQSCDALHATLPAWTSNGFTFDRWNESAGDGLACNLAGTADGLRAGAQVSDNGDIELNALAIQK